jgi:autotransporter translocation and assembly factor TamB
MKSFAFLSGIALMVLGCGGGDSTAPPEVPNVAGTYEGAFTLTASSTAGNQNLGSFPATATITQQGSDLSIAIADQEGGSLTFTGTVVAGGAITLDDEPDLSGIEAALPQCSFASAVANNSASVVSGTFVATANVVGASCPWGEEGSELLPTSFQFRFEGS